MTDPSQLQLEPQVAATGARRGRKLPGWRKEALRTTFWLVPAVMVVAAGLLFTITILIDLAAFHHQLTLPFWLRTGSADAGRQVLIAIAAAVITVIGVVFSITILALTLASQQFGPRMMRFFVRDLGNQMTLGIFVGTFVYSVLTLGFITSTRTGVFVPHLSITTSEGLLLIDLGVLIYFIHHIAKSIQLPEVIAGIAGDLFLAIDSEFPETVEDPTPGSEGVGRSADELVKILDERGTTVPATSNGYLQYVAYSELISIASKLDAVIRLSYRPGHFVIAGRPLATVWPGGAAEQARKALSSAHLTGPHRTLNQDPVFAIDQLAEIAIRALSPAVNDTFTALTCIDWLAAGLAQISGRVLREGIYRDQHGMIRLIVVESAYERMVNRAFDKVRQASRGMPAVLIRLLDSLGNVVRYTHNPHQRGVLRRQAEMILRNAEQTVEEPNDLADIRDRYESFLGVSLRMRNSASEEQPGVLGATPT